MSKSNGHQKLIAQAVSGDRVALEQLLLDHYTRLSRHIAPKLAGPLERLLSAEDIVQETLIGAVNSIATCKCRTEVSFGAWLNAIADHRLFDAVKKLKRKKRGGDLKRLSLDLVKVADSADLDQVLAIDSAISGLREFSERAATLGGW